MSQNKKKVRVLVVDDSKFTRQVFKRIFRDDDLIDVVGEGRNGIEAIELNKKLKPDVITLDVDMPEMGGLEALEKIIETRPVPVLMVSSHTREQSELTFLALERGAVDFVDKKAVESPLDLGQLGNQLREKILGAAGAVTGLREEDSGEEAMERTMNEIAEVSPPERLVIIGASTGGPPIVQQIIRSLPEYARDVYVIVQHMPKGFTASFAARLNRLASLPVREITETQKLLRGQVWVATAGMHVQFKLDANDFPEASLRVPQDDEALYKPSIDIAFDAAACFGARTLAVVLTGMGADGSEGVKSVVSAGGRVIVQEPKTAVLPSMPMAAIKSVPQALVLKPSELATYFA